MTTVCLWALFYSASHIVNFPIGSFSTSFNGVEKQKCLGNRKEEVQEAKDMTIPEVPCWRQPSWPYVQDGQSEMNSLSPVRTQDWSSLLKVNHLQASTSLQSAAHSSTSVARSPDMKIPFTLAKHMTWTSRIISSNLLKSIYLALGTKHSSAKQETSPEVQLGHTETLSSPQKTKQKQSCEGEIAWEALSCIEMIVHTNRSPWVIAEVVTAFNTCTVFQTFQIAQWCGGFIKIHRTYTLSVHKATNWFLP